jgi:hypothetical protein
MMFHPDQLLVVHFLLLLLDGLPSNSFTLLYNTEDSISTQYYDCIYYTNLANSIQGVKHQNCSNRGKLLPFSQLKVMNISPDNVLEWSTSVEQVDKYAKYFAQNTSITASDFYLCNCTNPDVFGKYCEYKFYSNRLTFDQSITKQFEPTNDDRTGSQYHNNRPCYATHFDCDFGLMCLDWRNICDGKKTSTSIIFII